MQFTIPEIARILNTSQDQILAALQESGIAYTCERSLTVSEMDRLRSALFRYYRSEKNRNNNTIPAEEPLQSPDSVDSQMEALVLERKIMIDTCSLMHEKCENVIQLLIPALQKYQKKILIPVKVIDELRKHQHFHKNSVKAVAANKGMALCRLLQESGCLSVRGSENDNFADNVFFVTFLNYRYQYKMLLITQDKYLTADILQLNSFQTVSGYPVEVMHITRQGKLKNSISPSCSDSFTQENTGI